MRKFGLVIGLAVALMVLAVPAFAQPNPLGVFCGDLPEADCALIEAAQANEFEIESATFDLLMETLIEDADPTMDEIAFTLGVNGAYQVDTAALTSYMDTFTNNPAMFSDFDAMGDALETLLRGVSADVDITLTVPEDVIAMTGGDFPNTITVESVMVEGVGYINLDPIAALDPTGSVPPGWHGTDTAEIYAQLFDMMGMMVGEEDMMSDEDMVDFTDPEFMSTFMSIERLDDAEVNGEPVAVFGITLDYAALMENETMRDMMMSQMQAQMAIAGGEMTEEEIDDILDMQLAIVEGMSLDMSYSIGLEDNYIRQVEIAFAWDIDMEALTDGMDTSSPSVSVDVTMTRSNFNDAPEIIVPDGARTYTFEELFFGATSQQAALSLVDAG